MSEESDGGLPEHIVRCPACGERTLYGPSNRFRPFCSGRCRGLDLGAWASEHFRVPADSRPEDQGLENPGIQ